MVGWKRALALGGLSWLLPFAASFLLFPFQRFNPALFETLMTLTVLLAAALLLRVYFRGRPVTVREAVLVGALWMAVNLVCDFPLFAFGPMQMTPGGYYSRIGLDYLVFPLFALGASRLAAARP